MRTLVKGFFPANIVQISSLKANKMKSSAKNNRKDDVQVMNIFTPAVQAALHNDYDDDIGHKLAVSKRWLSTSLRMHAAVNTHTHI
ncbi:MAG TPA: hypothetical protein VGO47_00120 [Chlamydiales bacterium]|nr:hypothetical protein [Chlamydiales bacterium]